MIISFRRMAIDLLASLLFIIVFFTGFFVAFSVTFGTHLVWNVLANWVSEGHLFNKNSGVQLSGTVLPAQD